MAKGLRIGVIGLGMGQHHVEGYLTHPEADVVALCDADEGRLAKQGKTFGIDRLYHDWRRMFDKERLDVVSVATPNVSHREIACAALDAGCHVLCEKPMAMNVTEAEQMRARSEECGKRLMINFSYRFLPMSFALKSQIDAGVIGDVYAARTAWHRRRGLPPFGSWFCRKELSGGGPLIDLGVHRIDLALWLMGYPEPTFVVGSTYDSIAAELAREKGERYTVEDLAIGFVKFANGATLQVEASWAINRPEKEFMETWLYGKKGGLVQKNVGGEYKFEATLFTEENGFHFTKRLSTSDTPVPVSMYHFVDCIVGGRPHIATADEGVKVMKIIDGVYQSAATGEPISFHIP
jgi:predicted dehydrogenase